MLTLELTSDIEQALKSLAHSQHKPLEQLLKDVIFDYLEDIHDAALGDAAMDDLMNGKSTTISFAEWERQLDDLGD